MRVTTNSSTKPFLNSLSAIQESKYKNEIRVDSGKKNLSLSDNPLDVVNSKILAERIDRNKSYINNIQESYSEMQMVNDTMDSIQDNIIKIRDVVISSTSPANSSNLSTLAKVLKTTLEDIVKDTNTEHNGKFIYSGTKTTSASLTEADSTTHQYPFELVQETPTPANPSGLVVKFYGNMEAREFNRDSITTEQVNTTADKIFGTGGVEALNEIVKLYNIMTYNADGTVRNPGDYYTLADTAKLNVAQKNIANYNEKIQNENAVNGAKTNRILAVNDQITEENIRLKAMLSEAQDTNYAETMMALAKDQNALQYALQSGNKLQTTTLLDFLR